ncbi:MAG: NADH-quinone oxidoreductase subunit M [Bdellovibrionaceae bacterium]|nr:NADH-quinone oxidoreductase subunit M [Bdellovibrionales bacterium]MCB9083791.1 NADH-quinone oxidoreductase subunit M [Pseudobdellovibrionaceae bacterium]
MGLLSVLVFLPLLTAFAVIMVPEQKWQRIRWICLASTGIHLVLTAVMTWEFWQEASRNLEAGKDSLLTQLYLVEKFAWFERFGIDYYLGVDGMSVAMMILTSIIIFTGVLASWEVKNRTKEFFALLFVLVTGVFGVFVSFDLFLFFVFYEVAVLPMYLLIGVWGTGPKEYSAMKLTLMLMVGSALILGGLLAVYHYSGIGTFDLIQLSQVEFPKEMQQWVFPLFFLGFGVLGALFPFHTWSPDGHASAPTAVSMLHAGVLMKLGGYGILRVGVYLLPEGAIQWALFFMILTTINVIYGAFGAIRQKDLKYFTAYSSVSHCGFVLFGICALNMMGMKGAVLQMFSHGIMTGLFFALIGMVYGRTHTRILPEMGGLAKVMPWLAVCFYIAGLASLGLPGFSGFVAESHVFLGGFFGNQWYSANITRVLTVIATMSIVVTAVYVLRGLAQVFQGPLTNQEFEKLSDARWFEKFSTGTLVLALAVVGIVPWFLVQMVETSIYPLLNRLVQAGSMMGLN